MIINIKASLTLSWSTIIKDYQESQTIINLIFTTDNITNKLIKCEINKKIKNFLNHLSIQTIIDFRVCKESAQKSCCNCKIMNEKKFINTLREQMLKSLSDQKVRCQCINEYTKQLLNALKKIVETFTFWARSHKMIKVRWMRKCMKIIKSI